MTIAEIAARAKVPVADAVKEMSRIMGVPLTPQSTLSTETAGMAVLILALTKIHQEKIS